MASIVYIGLQKDYLKKSFSNLKPFLSIPYNGFERRQKPRADRRVENVQENRRFGRLVENRCQTRLSRYFSNDIPKLHSNSAHSTSADNTATPQPTDRVPLSNETSDPKRSLVQCDIVADYRTVVDDLLKFVEFIDWLHDNYPELLPLHIPSL